MDKEIWKEIKGTNGEYYVSNKGRVYAQSRMVRNGTNSYRKTKAHILFPRKQRGGYLTVQIYNKNKYIHRLVAEAFIDNTQKLPQVNHKDENKSNNNVENLEWCDAKYNLRYGTRSIRERQTKNKRYMVINKDTGEIYGPPKEAAKKLNVSNDCITLACRGKIKTTAGCRLGYIYGHSLS